MVIGGVWRPIPRRFRAFFTVRLRSPSGPSRFRRKWTGNDATTTLFRLGRVLWTPHPTQRISARTRTSGVQRRFSRRVQNTKKNVQHNGAAALSVGKCFPPPPTTSTFLARGVIAVSVCLCCSKICTIRRFTPRPTGAHTRAYAFIARERVDYGCSDNKHNNYIRFGLLAPRARTHNGDPLLRVLIIIITTIDRVTARFFPFFLSPHTPFTYLTLPSCFVRKTKSQKPRRLRPDDDAHGRAEIFVIEMCIPAVLNLL